MPTSIARVEANRRNALRSTGPKSEAGKQRSRRNAVKHGLTGVGVVLPDSIVERARTFEPGLRAEYAVRDDDAVGRFLVAQAALAMARMEASPGVESDLRLEQLDRAEGSWELDRVVEAALLGDRLARRPAVVALQLAQTAQGCTWLIERWTALINTIEATGASDDLIRGMIADLLGVPPELRAGDPRLAADRPAAELLAMAREECSALARLKADVLDDRDDRDHSRALAGLTFDDSPAARRLRGYESACDRRLRWAIAQLRRRQAGSSPIAPPSSPLSWPAPAEAEAEAEAEAAPRSTPAPPAEAAEPSRSPGGPNPAILPGRPAPSRPSRIDVAPARSAPADRLENRTQPHPGARPPGPAEAAPLLNRRARRRAAAQARRAR